MAGIANTNPTTFEEKKAYTEQLLVRIAHAPVFSAERDALRQELYTYSWPELHPDEAAEAED